MNNQSMERIEPLINKLMELSNSIENSNRELRTVFSELNQVKISPERVILNSAGIFEELIRIENKAKEIKRHINANNEEMLVVIDKLNILISQQRT